MITYVKSSNLLIYGMSVQHLCIVQDVISPDFPIKLTGFFLGKHSIHFLALKMKAEQSLPKASSHQSQEQENYSKP